MDHKDGKWARQILADRDAEGLWGNFHTLSTPVSGRALTTEQAIRRLRILGFTKQDEPIQVVMRRMCQCVSGQRKIDDYSEKKHDWPLFEKLMLSAWIRLFDPENEVALGVARQWAAIAEAAFASGQYRQSDDIEAFRRQFGRAPKSGFETGFGIFYHAALLQGVLSPATEERFLDYTLSRPQGMYYIYDKCLGAPPQTFATKETSRYLAAIEVLAAYRLAPRKLGFVADWLLGQRDENGQWDLGPAAKDGVYFPLSDSWQKPAYRKADCTQRVAALLQRIAPGAL